MLVIKALANARCAFSTEVKLARVPFLVPANLETFRATAFKPSRPIQIIDHQSLQLPAIQKWFSRDKNGQAALNISYLTKYGSTVVPLELTTAHDGVQQFARLERPLSEFLAFIEQRQSVNNDVSANNSFAERTPQIYLAQCSLSTLPQELVNDVPTPQLVQNAGRGDIYDSSIWIGLAQTYTPLHKDPNPNLFVQLAGTKLVRIFEPAIGQELFFESQKRLGTHASASIRGEEMMQGEEKRILEEMVWGEQSELYASKSASYEAQVEQGDALFIPKGWWHSIKGISSGVVGSVNWWFR